MLLRRLIWLALVLAVGVGSVQTLLQQQFAMPLLVQAETFEGHTAPDVAHSHAAPASPATPEVAAHDHDHGGDAWAPQDGFERTAWTWVANVMDSLALALGVLVALSGRVLRRGVPASVPRLAAGVALAGFVGLHLWPALGLPAELPGAQAADLVARQMWWGFAAVCALLACALLGWVRGAWAWRAPVALALLVLPFALGAPHVGEPYAAFAPDVAQTLGDLTARFAVIGHLLAALQWALLGAGAAVLFQRGLLPLLPRTGARGAPALSPQEIR